MNYTGKRILYQSPSFNRAGHMVNVMQAVYLSLAQPVSGVVLADRDGCLNIRPDGWPLPEGIWPRGFTARTSACSLYDGPARPARLVNALGLEIPRRVALGLVSAWLERAESFYFESITRDDAKKAVLDELRGLCDTTIQEI